MSIEAEFWSLSNELEQLVLRLSEGYGPYNSNARSLLPITVIIGSNDVLYRQRPFFSPGFFSEVLTLFSEVMTFGSNDTQS